MATETEQQPVERSAAQESQPRPAPIEAIYDGRYLQPISPLDPAPGSRVRLALLDTQAPRKPESSVIALSQIGRFEWLLLATGMLLYSITRFTGLTLFPIYFFCDEAIQTNLARELLNNGLRSADGTFLPPYFYNAEKWSLSLSIYVHLIGVALFSNSVVATRAVTALVSLLACGALALTLRLVFQLRFWWAAPLVLTITPAWFFHSRSAFETVMMVAFYACFLCCYLLYRYRSPQYLFAAGIFGAMTFYSYANGQGVMLVSLVLLLLLDIRHHLRQPPRIILGAIGLALILAIPFLRFRMLQPVGVENHLFALHSYWTKPLPLGEKLATFAGNYLKGLSPIYWFLPNDTDLDRHRWLGLGHLHLLTAPLIIAGLLVCLRNWRSAAHRAVLVAVLAAPFSAALVDIGITRVLAMVLPAALLACLGLEAVFNLLKHWASYRAVAIGTTLICSFVGIGMLRSALSEGPTWFTNYGLGGMQYGAQQIFGEAIPEVLRADLESRLLVSPTWANNPNTFPTFFLSPAQQARMEFINIDAFTVSRRELSPQMLFVMPDYEYERALSSGKFVIEAPERIISYPDGRPGFYFARMRYVDNIDALFAADRAARQQLVENQVTIGEQAVTLKHSLLDMGQPSDMFDGDVNTLLRGMEANPLVFELSFSEPRQLGGFDLTVASMNADLKVIITDAGGATSSGTQSYIGQPFDPTLSYSLPNGPQLISHLRIELTQLNAGEVAHVHVRELVLR